MRRATDSFWMIAGAASGAAALALLHSRPFALIVSLIALNALFLAFRHDAVSLAGFLTGLIFGNVTELAADLAGLWIHPAPQLFGVAPYYIFACYPVLGLAFPRLIANVTGRAMPKEDGARPHFGHAIALWALLIGGTCLLGRSNGPARVFCVVVTVLIPIRFHSRTDLASAPVGALLGMVWEIPCTLSGAWRFPQPELFGLIPLWLPFAYAGYFVVLGRITAGMTQWIEHLPGR